MRIALFSSLLALAVVPLHARFLTHLGALPPQQPQQSPSPSQSQSQSQSQNQRPTAIPDAISNTNAKSVSVNGGVSFRTMAMAAYNSFATSADAPLNDPNCAQNHVVLKAYGQNGVGLQSADCKLQFLAEMPDNTMGYVTANNYNIDTVDWLPSSTRFLLLFHNKMQQAKLPKDAKQLEFVDLSFNVIESLKDATLPDSLKQLDLSNNKISSLEGATFPSSLEYLDVSENPIESLKNVKFPSKLKTLRLGGTKITTLKDVNLNNINTLYLSTIPSDLERQKNVDTVFFESPDVTFLKDLALKPKTLGLDSVTVTTLEGYDFTKDLTRLSLANTPITSLANVTLSKVKELTINGNQLDNINDLDFFSKLESLSWINTPLGDTKLPDDLKSLYIYKADVTSDVTLPRKVEQLAVMDSVDLTEQLGKLSNLKSLILSPPDFKSSDLKLSRKLEYLEINYDCDSTAISGVDFPSDLKTFSFGPCAVSSFEIPQRNVKTFEKMDGLYVKIGGDGCSNGAKATTIQGKPFCVLDDKSFDQKNPDAKNYPSDSDSSAISHQWNWQLVMAWAAMTSVWWLNMA